MARPAPQADVADPALVGGIGAEAFELRVGQRLAGDADEQDERRRDNPGSAAPRTGNRDATKIANTSGIEPKPWFCRNTEHLARRIDAPFLGKRRIARIVGDARGARSRYASRAGSTRSPPARPPAIAAGWAPRPPPAIAHWRRRPGPSEKVQMVSTQPELPVRCCTTQAPVIRTDSETAIASQRLQIQKGSCRMPAITA